MYVLCDNYFCVLSGLGGIFCRNYFLHLTKHGDMNTGSAVLAARSQNTPIVLCIDASISPQRSRPTEQPQKLFILLLFGVQILRLRWFVATAQTSFDLFQLGPGLPTSLFAHLRFNLIDRFAQRLGLRFLVTETGFDRRQTAILLDHLCLRLLPVCASGLAKLHMTIHCAAE